MGMEMMMRDGCVCEIICLQESNGWVWNAVGVVVMAARVLQGFTPIPLLLSTLLSFLVLLAFPSTTNCADT